MPPVVVVDSISKTFPHRARIVGRGPGTRALDSVSLSAAAGSVLVLLGANGSGKTTLLKLVSGLLLPDAGRICVAGYDTRRHGSLMRRQVGFAVAGERSFFPRLTARENLEYFAALENLSKAQCSRRIEELLVAVGLHDHAGKLVREFSSGMYQRLAMARALLKTPSVLLLDEPSRSLDPVAAFDLSRLVREAAARGSTVLVASHSFEEAAILADQLVVLDRGVLVGHRNVEGGLAPGELRSFYFQTIGGREPVPEFALGGVP